MQSYPAFPTLPQIQATTDHTRSEARRHCQIYEEGTPESCDNRECYCGMPLAADGRCPDGHYAGRRRKSRSW